MYEIWGPHSSENVDVGLLGYNAMWIYLKMEAVCSSKMVVSTYKYTWYYNSEDKHQQHCLLSENYFINILF